MPTAGKNFYVDKTGVINEWFGFAMVFQINVCVFVTGYGFIALC
jgi:hypothetical protein